MKPRDSDPGPAGSAQSGLTLIELLIVCALMAVIAAITIPFVVRLIEQTRLRGVEVDLRTIEMDLSDYRRANDELPDSLAGLRVPLPVDPWGHPYEYLVFRGPGWLGKARKDRFLVPINTEYDLYSVGPDGETRPPLQNKASLDDFIRANDGAYHGLARDY